MSDVKEGLKFPIITEGEHVGKIDGKSLNRLLEKKCDRIYRNEGKGCGVYDIMEYDKGNTPPIDPEYVLTLSPAGMRKLLCYVTCLENWAIHFAIQTPEEDFMEWIGNEEFF